MKSANSLNAEIKAEYLRSIFSANFDAQIDQMDKNFDVLMLRLGKFLTKFGSLTKFGASTKIGKSIFCSVDSLRDESKHQKSDAVLNLVVKLDFNHYFSKVASRE